MLDIINLNSTEDNNAPCGTPDKTSPLSDIVPFAIALNLLFVKTPQSIFLAYLLCSFCSLSEFYSLPCQKVKKTCIHFHFIVFVFHYVL